MVIHSNNYLFLLSGFIERHLLSGFYREVFIELSLTH